MAKKRKKQSGIDPTLPIYQLKITLDDVRPAIWRRVHLDDCALDELHQIIQVCMGWEDYHMHAFEVGGVEYGDPESADDPDNCNDSSSITLSQILEDHGACFSYEYDFGDSWRHTIEIEKTLRPRAGVLYPRCVEGRRAGPPEDCGGPWEYQDLLEAKRNEDDEDYAEALDGYEDFDPDAFDLDAVNREFARLRTWLGQVKGRHSPEPKFAEGDSVRVKRGATHPDYPDLPLGGWTGEVHRVVHLTPMGYVVRWNEETLQSVHPVYVRRCQRDDTDVKELWLNEEDLETDDGSGLPIDQPTVIVTRPLSPDDREDRIRAALGLTSDDPLPATDPQTQENYARYLAARLSFPLQAEYWDDKTQSLRPLTVVGLSDHPAINPETGILCKARTEKGNRVLPLANLIPPDDGPHRQLLDDYSHWQSEVQEVIRFAQLEDEDSEDEEDSEIDDDFEHDVVFEPPEEDDAEESPAPPQYPIGTIALYGPDDKKTTKIVAGVITSRHAEPIIERWVGSAVKDSPKVRRQIESFFRKHKVQAVVSSEENIGCPHEEGDDFPVGGDCPFCPFWKGKQGSGKRD